MADDRFYVKSLTLENFRCFDKAELGPFDPHFNLIVGENGAGKSSILVALADLFRQFGSPELNGPGKSLIGREDARLEHWLGVDGVTTIKPHLGGVVWAKFQWNKNEWIASSYVSDPNPFAAGNHREVVNNPSMPGLLFRPGLNTRAQIADEPLTLILCYTVRRNFIGSLAASTDAFDNSLIRLGALANWENAGVNSSALREWLKDQTLAELQRFQRASVTGSAVENSRLFNQLRAVLKAVEVAVEDVAAFEYDHNRHDTVVQWQSGLRQDFLTMSDGQRMMIGLIADIVRRVCQLNAAFLGEKTLLETPGLVLIDEIDLHLHPKWQRQIVPALKTIFPKIQFFATTHSPQVIGECQPKEIVLLTKDGRQERPPGSFGMDSNWILECVMDAEGRDPEIAKRIKSLFDLIDDDRLEEAKAEIRKLREELPDLAPDIIAAETYIWNLEHTGDEAAE